MNKKPPASSELDPSEDPELVAKVEAMMEPSKPVPAAKAKAQPIKVVISDEPQRQPDDTTPPPLDIFSDVQGPPPLTKGKKAVAVQEGQPAEDEPEPKLVDEAVPTETEEEAIPEESKSEPTNEAEPTEESDTVAVVVEEAAIEAVPDPVETEPEQEKAEEFDDEHTSALVDEIERTERQTTQPQKANRPSKKKPHTHPLFWLLIALLAVIAVCFALWFFDPAVAAEAKVVYHKLRG